jgi:prephenate dehydrogenase
MRCAGRRARRRGSWFTWRCRWDSRSNGCGILRGTWRRGALVTDAASTKRAVCAAARRFFRRRRVFSAGIPMAGKEGSGLDAAEATLFRGAQYALIGAASDGDAESESREVRRVAQGDRRTTGLDGCATHDRASRWFRTCRNLWPWRLAGVVREATDQTGLPLTLAGRGLRDALRLAGSPYSVWRDIVLTNTDNLEPRWTDCRKRSRISGGTCGARARRRICRGQRGLQNPARFAVNFFREA